jgi:hypothetical protein
VTVGRVAAGLLLAAALLAAVSWLASPWVAFHAFREAARAGDRDGLAELVDYAALRSSLAPQLRAEAEARRRAEQARAAAAARQTPPDDSLAAVGRRMLERLGRAADSAAEVTAPVLAPLGLEQAVERRLEPASLAALADGPSQLRYVSPSRVQVQVRGPRGPLFVMERSRLFAWDVVHVALPAP